MAQRRSKYTAHRRAPSGRRSCRSRGRRRSAGCRFSSASPLASLPCTSVPGGSSGRARPRPGSSCRSGPRAHCANCASWPADTSAATSKPRPDVHWRAARKRRQRRPRERRPGAVHEDRDGRAEAHARAAARRVRRAAPARRRPRTGRRRRSASRRAPSCAALPGARIRQQAAFSAEHDGGQRDQRRNEEDETALVADVVQEQLERRPARSTARAAARAGATVRHRASARNQSHGADDHGEPHAREDVVDDGKPRHAVQQRPQVVARLSRHRHLPVVEAVVGPVREHERSRAPRCRRRGEAGERGDRRPAAGGGIGSRRVEPG